MSGFCGVESFVVFIRSGASNVGAIYLEQPVAPPVEGRQDRRVNVAAVYALKERENGRLSD